MNADIQDQVVNKMKASQSFLLQVDGLADLSEQAHLVSFVGYTDEDDIKEHIYNRGNYFPCLNEFFFRRGIS